MRFPFITRAWRTQRLLCWSNRAQKNGKGMNTINTRHNCRVSLYFFSCKINSILLLHMPSHGYVENKLFTQLVKGLYFSHFKYQLLLCFTHPIFFNWILTTEEHGLKQMKSCHYKQEHGSHGLLSSYENKYRVIGWELTHVTFETSTMGFPWGGTLAYHMPAATKAATATNMNAAGTPNAKG